MSTSTPPAWHWLDECYVPVQAYQHMTKDSSTPDPGYFPADVDEMCRNYTEAELSTDPRILPDTATFRERNDSDQCANGEQNLPSALIPSDECSEFRSAPGQPHAPECERTAQNYNEHINAAPSHRIGTCYLDPDTGETVMPGDFFGEKELRWKRNESGQGAGQEADAAEENPLQSPAQMADKIVDKMADKTAWAALMAEGYREMAGDYCEPEPARSAIGAGPLFGTVTDTADKSSVPFQTQEWIFESLAECELVKLHDLLDTHHDRIIEMARDRFRRGYAKYGSAAYLWDAETRLTNVLEELADAVVYLTTGPME